MFMNRVARPNHQQPMSAVEAREISQSTFKERIPREVVRRTKVEDMNKRIRTEDGRLHRLIDRMVNGEEVVGLVLSILFHAQGDQNLRPGVLERFLDVVGGQNLDQVQRVEFHRLLNDMSGGRISEDEVAEVLIEAHKSGRLCHDIRDRFIGAVRSGDLKDDFREAVGSI